ncbi:MAG: hypothetical protein HOV73_18490 [Streptomyces sp.]|nr:hypothetical protein [Streptomyces sp.]NUR42072.1 hypothetical protein [Streptomyces sp.]NUS15230.1 hypothetical protein [Streptomyces sp.]NUS25570.1 hypothetical protein [Streptomyces sp.]NUS76552.1 hypothetical protein [Streptomyces sp.]
MTTLHLSPADVTSLHQGDDGTVTIELTSSGERALVDAAGRQKPLLEKAEAQFAEQRQAYLQSLSNAQLLDLARERFGGPEEDVLAEAWRRIRVASEAMRPVFDSLREAGVLKST